jgi:hypothetical protein
MIVCLVLYILLYALCYFIICVCQWEHVYESLCDCVSCPVYIVVRLMLFHYRCVSVGACFWKFVWLCVLYCIYCRTSYVISLYVCVGESMCMKVCMIVCCPVYIVVRLMLFHYRCLSVRACVLKFVWLCVLSCIYCRTSYVISLYVCVIESMCMKVCMIVCHVLYILSYVLCYFIIGVCQWEHVYESLYDCVSGTVYNVVRLVLFHYRCVSVRACAWKCVWLCVLSCIYCRMSYVIQL